MYLLYSDDHVEMMKGCGSASVAQLNELSEKHDSVYFSEVSAVVMIL